MASKLPVGRIEFMVRCYSARPGLKLRGNSPAIAAIPATKKDHIGLKLPLRVSANNSPTVALKYV